MAKLPRDAYPRAIESGDGAALMDSFAENVVSYVPVDYEPIRGRQGIVQFIGTLGKVFQNFSYTYERETKDGMVLMFDAEVPPPPGSDGPNIGLNAIDLLVFDDNNRIIKFTGVARPRKALDALLALGLGEIYDEVIGRKTPSTSEPPPPMGTVGELAGSMLGFSGAMTLFGARQLGALINPGRAGAIQAFDAVTKVTVGQCGHEARSLFEEADAAQRKTLGSVFTAPLVNSSE